MKNPSWSNAGWLAADVGAALIPFVPAALNFYYCHEIILIGLLPIFGQTDILERALLSGFSFGFAAFRTRSTVWS